ncbi:MAG: glycosyltransferase family 2 protein [Chitinophagales bacterium]
MTNRVKVAVVILGWNGKRFLEQFLPSVVQHSQISGVQVVYADNASSDDSVAFVRERFPSVHIVETGANRGFAGGYNYALKQLDAEYFLLLNQDVEVSAGWLEPLISYLDQHPEVAAAQPKLRAFHERNSFEYAGASGGFMDSLGYAFCRGRLFDTVEPDHGQYESIVDIFWASGAALFVRSSVYWEVGGLDEDFFAHQEEIDLCWRIWNYGHRIVVIPESIVYHVGGGSLPQGNPRKTYLNFRNNLFLLMKNLPASALWWKLPLRWILDVVAAWQSLLKAKKTADFLAIAKAHIHALQGAGKMLSKRQQITAQVPLFSGSVVWAYFIQGKRRFTEL